ncbi:MAG: putative flavodoxin [Proteobacteria bacterium]|nr:putative flavodoxin [Pseudomonadota bacterium]
MKGVHSVQEDAEIEMIHLYDYTYTGCKSCFTCQRKNGKPLECAVCDDIHDILKGAFDSDGIIFATPIYFHDISAQLRGFLERLMYPGVSPKDVPTALIYTMNATEQQMEEFHFETNLATSKLFLGHTFHVTPEQIFAFNTYQHKNYDDYRSTRHNEAEKRAWHKRASV